MHSRRLLALCWADFVLDAKAALHPSFPGPALAAMESPKFAWQLSVVKQHLLILWSTSILGSRFAEQC